MQNRTAPAAQDARGFTILPKLLPASGILNKQREERTVTSVEALSDSLVGEIFKALGLAENGWARRRFGGVFRKAAVRLSRVGVTFDQLCARDGFGAAAEWALTHWCTDIRARGVEHVPPDKPLLVISNHPGTYDALVIASRLRRDDLRLISSDIPFLKQLPHAKDHFFFVDMDPLVRANATRKGIRHLEKGGAILLYGSGEIDPDPALSGEAPHHIDRWSRSIELFLRRVPETRVLLSVVSHSVSARWARSPISWFRRLPLDKRRLVEFGQVLQQLFFPGSLYLSPRLSFAAPIRVDELRAEAGTSALLPTIIAREKQLLSEHLAAFGASRILSTTRP